MMSFSVVASDPKIKTYFENSLKKGNFLRYMMSILFIS